MDQPLSNNVQETRQYSRKMVRELGFLRPGAAIGETPFAQCHTLIELEERGSLTVGELADILKVDKSAASRTVSQMLKTNLITAHQDKRDPRRKPVSLTSNGKQRLREIHRETNHEVSEALALLSPTEQLKVVEGLKLYADALQKLNRQAGYTIRALRKSDNRDVASVIRTVMPEFGADKPGFAIHDPEVENMYGTYHVEDSVYFVIEYKGAVIGGAGIAPLAGADRDTCELRKMYFLPEARGRGLGKRLLSMCLEEAKKLGYKRCYLETLERMHQAQHLYKSFGFKKLGKPMGATGHFGCDAWYLLDF